MNKGMLRVGLFVTCLVDLFRPSVGFAAVKLLEDAGCTVEVPTRRPAAASRPTIPATAPTRAGIAAAGDRGLRGLRLCRRAVGLLRRHAASALSRAVRRRSAMARRGPRRFAAKTLRAGLVPGRRAAASSAVARALRRRASPITIPARACASSASRRSRARCSRSVEGLAADGAGRRRGLLRLRRHVLRQISRHLRRHRRRKKADDIAATGADTLLAGDLGCLMNMAGKLQREGSRSRRATSPRCWPA